MNFPPVSAKPFTAIQNLNIAELAECTQREIRPLLPSLVRMSLLSPLDTTSISSTDSRKQILSILVGIEIVNNIVSLLQVNYHELEIDVRKEQQLRQKLGPTAPPVYIQEQGQVSGVTTYFERADVTKKVRVVLSELFYIQALVQAEQNVLGGGAGATGSTRSSSDNVLKESELFDNEIYHEEIADIICIALAELPSLLTIQEVVETLLYVNNGTNIICWVVANMPDCFKEVLTSLVSNGDEETPEGKHRLAALCNLCDMNPGQALSIRTICLDLCKMPSLMLKLSLKDPQDLIAFVSGLLLGNDQTTRSWFAAFVRTSQKKKGDTLQLVRDELLKQLQSLVVFSINSHLPEECVVQATAILRLYCALRGIAWIKFNDDEIHLLIQLVTSKPPPTPAGIRFVSLGVCMLIACPSLISQPALETKGIEWVQWLIKDETYFESNSGVAASFGEMLLLMAIHFHSNQFSAICELVNSTLGMKIGLRPNNTTRMKQIFIQEIFTEQVVASHAIKVPVTPNLNANIPGYLSVHCIHQLLKSRAFSKHKVPIKSWIFKQICNSSTPLHPVLPALIEVYVNSIIVPTAKGPVEHTHNPLSEREILKVFQCSVVGEHIVTKNKLFTYECEADSAVTSIERDSDVDEEVIGSPNLTSQLLLLYYLLLYEDVRLSNMVTIITSGRKIKSYSIEFLSELPIKYLLQQAQKNQHEFGGLFSPLLKLLILHFPHLSLVDDWIEEESIPLVSKTSLPLTEFLLVEAFEELEVFPSKLVKLLKIMMKKSPTDIWPYAKTFIKYFQKILDFNVPRLVQELYRHVWIRLNTVLPRRLWIMSVNALMPNDHIAQHLVSHTADNILIDPLQVLRCHERIFRTPDALAIVLRILQASLAASKSQLSRHILDKPLMEKNGQLQTEKEREDLKHALIASQESVAVQILLEACLETEDDKLKPGREWALREVRGIICTYIHHVFISEPSLAKLVHFQGYPRELLEIIVRGIPSMHICFDFIPELLCMGEMEKQIFAIDLTSYLALQYALPKTLSIAKLCINTLSTLIGVLPSDARVEMFRSILPCISRFAEAFPPLLNDCITFLHQLGRIAESQAALGRTASLSLMAITPRTRTRDQNEHLESTETFIDEIKETFNKLLDDGVFKPRIY